MNFIPQRKPQGGWSVPRRLYVLIALIAAAGLATGIVALASVGSDAGFEDNDANLTVNSSFDWNGFSPLTWNGTAPQRTSSKVTSGLSPASRNGWSFNGFEDSTATNSDNGFAGGVKQDDDCGTLKNGKAPNKDDLKRVYIATKTVPLGSPAVNHVFLELAFVRIPLNSTQSSTHIGFEFNEKRLGTCGGSSSLFKRTPQAYGGNPAQSGGDPTNPGDLLIVYDYEGSTTSPTLTLRHWIDSGSTIGQACEISSDSPPCWSTASPLTAAGFAEAQVNFGSGGVPGAGITDSLAPDSPPETLGLKEFGEAGVDLTAAGVFGPSTCLGFGQSEAVSRSSGNSGSAAMEDLVAGPVNISNCGTITIIKHTSPRSLDQNFTYTSNLHPNSQAGGVSGVDASGNFSLNDHNGTNPPADSGTNKVSESDLQAGTYTITEGADPATFGFDSVTCSPSAKATIVGKQVTINLAANDNVTCTYVNNLLVGSLKVSKVSSKTGSAPLTGAHFRMCKNDGPYTQANPCDPAVTGGDDLDSGSASFICKDNVVVGDYYVSEKTAPTGYKIDDTAAKKVTVTSGTKCSDDPYTGAAFQFSDTPLTNLTVHAVSQVTGGTKSNIKCTGPSPGTSDVGNSPQPPDSGSPPTKQFAEDVTVSATGTSGLSPGVYTCIVDIDP
jgi:hypothetical protein